MGRDELAKRADRLVRGQWSGLIAEVRSCTSRTCPVPKNDADDHMRRGLAAQSRVQRGQVSRARHELTGAALAPKDEITLAELRSRRPQSRAHDIPQAIIDYIPESPLQLDAKIFAKCLQTAPSGSAPGPGGCTNEMLRVCLDDVETLSLLISAAEDFARAETPPAAQSFMLATVTALRKKDGGVRGIATGSSFRRLVAKTLAKQFSTAVNDTLCTVPVYCVGHAVRFATDADPEATVLSIDGVGAYDLVSRSSMMSKLWVTPSLRKLLPFVRSVYGRPSCYMWRDSEGGCHDIHQHEGGEQGDPLMPLLFSLATTLY